MSEAKIDKGVPIPKGGRQRYPIPQLEVGESFFVEVVPPDDKNLRIKQAVLSTCTARVARKLGRKFTSRKVEEKGKHGIRTWRIE